MLSRHLSAENYHSEMLPTSQVFPLRNGLWGVGQGEGLGVQEAIADDPKGDSVQVEVEGGRDLENAMLWDTLW